MMMAHPALSKAIRGSSTTMAALNPTTHWSQVFRRLFWTPIELQKTYILIVLLGTPVFIAMRSRILNARGSDAVAADTPLRDALRSAGEYVPIFLEPIFAFTIPLAGILCALVMWKPLPFGKRDYVWSLPVDRPAHDLLRVASGATHLILALLLVALMGAGFALLEGIPPFPQRSPLSPWGNWPFWLSFFGLPVALYLAASIAGLATRLPIVWIYGAIAFLILPLTVADNLDAPVLDHLVRVSMSGTPPRSESMALLPTLTHGYGSGFTSWALGTTLDDAGPTTITIEGRYLLILRYIGYPVVRGHLTWLLACTLWMIPILGGLWLAARRKI